MIQLHYQSYHENQSQVPIILLHGLFGSLTNWGSIARQLKTHWVITPDLRNHGKSPHVDDMSYAAMAQDILTLMDELNIHHAHLIGHSMGGKVAMQFALQYPERTASLAVVDIAPVIYTHHHHQIFDAFDSIHLEKIQSRAEALKQMLSSALHQSVAAFLLQNLQRNTKGWYWRINLPTLKKYSAEIIGYPDTGNLVYTEKTWFIYGDQSNYVLPQYHSAIFHKFPNTIFCPVAKAGHWVHSDQPEKFIQSLNDFLHH